MSEIIEFGHYPVAPGPGNLQARPDRRAVASVLPHDSALRVAELSADGWRYETPHRQVYPRSLVYSSAGRLAYVAQDADQQFVVVDDIARDDCWDAISDEIGWSSDGQNYSFVGKRSEEYFVVAPDNVWQIQGAPQVRRFAQNRDGSQIGWVTQQTFKQQLFVNGRLRSEAAEILQNPAWSPDGKRIAFAVSDERGITVHVDDEEFGPYPSINKGTPIWSPDSRRCGWVIQRKGKAVLIVNGDERALPFSIVQGGTLAFSPNGSRWALTARTGLLNLKGCIVIDGDSGPLYMGLGLTPPVWNPAGDSLAYFVAKGLKTTFIVCDGREGQHSTAFIDGSLTWSPDGEVVGGLAQQNGETCVVLEGRKGLSISLRPQKGSLIRGEGVAFDGENSLHDLGFAEGGLVFGWTVRY